MLDSTVTAQDIKHVRFSFWFVWVIANALGLGFGWSVGELLGQEIVKLYGWTAGIVVGTITCESIIWLFRSLVLSRNRSFALLDKLDRLIWIVTEALIWIGISNLAPPDPESIFGVTSGTVLAFSIGAGVWLVIWAIRIPKPHSKEWAVQAIFLAFLFFGLGNCLLGVMVVGSIEIGETLAKVTSKLLGIAAAGTFMGGSIGALTGLALTKLIFIRPTNDGP